MNLFTVVDAEEVCNVEKTICPVSAILSAASAVSLSRISQTKIIFGSSLIADLRALAKDRVSLPTSL